MNDFLSAETMNRELKIFGGRAHPALTQEICDYLELPVGNVIVQVFRISDGHSVVTTVNLPAAGVAVEQDLVMIPPNRFGVVFIPAVGS